MNREERRKLKRSGKMVALLAELQKSSEDEFEKSRIHDGDIVKLNVKKITEHKQYPRLQAEYRKFVETNEDRLFTARTVKLTQKESRVLIEFAEDPTWLFHMSDLIRIQNGGDENK